MTFHHVELSTCSYYQHSCRLKQLLHRYWEDQLYVCDAGRGCCPFLFLFPSLSAFYFHTSETLIDDIYSRACESSQKKFWALLLIPALSGWRTQGSVTAHFISRTRSQRTTEELLFLCLHLTNMRSSILSLPAVVSLHPFPITAVWFQWTLREQIFLHESFCRTTTILCFSPFWLRSVRWCFGSGHAGHKNNNDFICHDLIRRLEWESTDMKPIAALWRSAQTSFELN